MVSGTADEADLPAQTDLALDDDNDLGIRALRTRQTILDATRQLFLDRGYAGTRINNITDACGISRAGFYTYFKDKRDVMRVLGETTNADTLSVIGEWDQIGRPASLAEVTEWVRRYFTYLDRHGAFVLSVSQSLPTDDEFRLDGRRMQMRVAFLLGVALRSRQTTPTPVPEALGLTVIAMLDRTWFMTRVQGLPVGHQDTTSTVSRCLMDILGGQDRAES